jgi:uroporphyrinogen decarboxylase
MKEKYSHRERLELILAGERPDRFAASFWRHFFHMEHHVEGTAEAMVTFQKHFGWDFVKINPRADYHAEPWGLTLRFSHHEFRKHDKGSFPVSTPNDWERIQPVPLTSPALAEHLKVVSIVRRSLGNDVPILMTVFTPLSVAGRLVEDQKLLAEHLRSHPDRVASALGAIAETFAAFATELRNAGADGLFFATTQWASSDLLSWQEYEEFGVPYDLRVIEATDNAPFNLLHVCCGNNFLDRLAGIDYRCRMYNWDSDDPTNRSLNDASGILEDKTLVGGVAQHDWLLQGTVLGVIDRILKLKQRVSASAVIIGPGCSIPPEVPNENLMAIKENLS